MKFAAIGAFVLIVGCSAGTESSEEPEVRSTSQAVSTMSPDDIIARAKPAMGYSYWWAHGAWRTDGAQHGSCSGSGCPNDCYHSGSYGADCSGLVAKVWQVPSDIDVTNDSHPYSTYNFRFESTHWGTVSRASAAKGDAFVYHSNGAGHIFLYESGDPWGSVWAYECKGCADGCVHDLRTAGSAYSVIRRDALGAPGPTIVEQIILPMPGTFDGSVSSDIDGDGLADACARHSGGVACARTNQSGFNDSTDIVPLSNANGWGSPQYYGTIRMADINGDKKADLCARGVAGVACWLSDGSTFSQQIDGPAWTDAGSWNQIQYWSTLRLADIDGDGMADLCARAAAGLVCHRSTGSGFGDAIQGPAMSDASGWGADMYYGTIRFADVNGDGKSDVCARHSTGFSCWLSDGNGFPTEIAGPALSNANGWGDVQYWSTIRMGDVDGDGKADLCARHSMGFSCWLSDGNGFPTEIAGPVLSNANGWSAIEYYSTLRLADINRDGKADLCARASASFVCWLSQGTSFGDPISGPDMSDAQGWNKPEYYSTFRVSNATNSNAAVCGRGSVGLVCWPFDGTGFGTAYSGPAWSDANGWNNVQYYSTLQFGGSWIAPAPSSGGAGGGSAGAPSSGGSDTSGGGGSWGTDAGISPKPPGQAGAKPSDSGGSGSCNMGRHHHPRSALLLALLGAWLLRLRRR